MLRAAALSRHVIFTLVLGSLLASVPSESLAAGGCIEDFECAEGEHCVLGDCKANEEDEKESSSPWEESEPTEPPPTTMSRGAMPERGTRLGLTNELLIGFAGDIGYKNPDPLYVLMLDLGFPIGRYMRWHIQFGYENFAETNGIRFNPLVFGYAVPVFSDGNKLSVEVEIIMALAQSETFFGTIMSGFVSSGLRAQAVVRYDMFFAALAPIGFEARYFAWTENDTATGFGVNWPLSLTLGIEQ